MTKGEMEFHSEQFNALGNDIAKWMWIKANQHLDMTIHLDNDDTYGQFGDDTDFDYGLQFDEYIGNSGGVDNLLAAMNIKAESV